MISVFKQNAKRFILNHKFLARRFGKVYFGLNKLDEKYPTFLITRTDISSNWALTMEYNNPILNTLNFIKDGKEF